MHTTTVSNQQAGPILPEGATKQRESTSTRVPMKWLSKEKNDQAEMTFTKVPLMWLPTNSKQRLGLLLDSGPGFTRVANP